MYIGQTALNTIVVKGKVFMIDSEQVQDGGMEIIPGNRVFSYFPANVIGSPVSASRLQTTTSHPGGKTLSIVTPTAA